MIVVKSVKRIIVKYVLLMDEAVKLMIGCVLMVLSSSVLSGLYMTLGFNNFPRKGSYKVSYSSDGRNTPRAETVLFTRVRSSRKWVELEKGYPPLNASPINWSLRCQESVSTMGKIESMTACKTSNYALLLHRDCFKKIFKTVQDCAPLC